MSCCFGFCCGNGGHEYGSCRRTIFLNGGLRRSGILLLVFLWQWRSTPAAALFSNGVLRRFGARRFCFGGDMIRSCRRTIF